MPITGYRDYRVSFTPTRVTQHKVSLPEALRMAVQGSVAASHVFGQCPPAIQQIMNDACRQSFQKGFLEVPSTQQQSLFAALLLAMENAEGTGVSPPAPAQPKKWWQFWR
jgi:hypothetical protein